MFYRKKNFGSIVSPVFFLPILFLCTAQIFIGCEKKDKESQPVVRIDGTVYYQSDLDAFARVTQHYPGMSHEFDLKDRLPVSALIECIAIGKRVRFSPAAWRYRFSNDWKWKKRYVIAANFVTDVLQRHMGYSDRDLETYYADNPSEFMSSVVQDSAGVICTTSVVIPLDQDLKRQIAEILFCRAYPPDSTFLATTRMPLGDQKAIEAHWVKYIRYEGYQKLFLEKYFRKKFGKAYPTSVDNLVGKGKILSEEDMQTLISWMSQKRRDHLRQDENARNNAAELLMRWYLFSEEAKSTGYALQPEMGATLKWLWKYELAQRHLSTLIAPLVKSEVGIDSTMGLYSYWDSHGFSGGGTDSIAMNRHFKQLIAAKTTDLLNSRLNTIRSKAKVVFLARKWDDNKTRRPAVLLCVADSLREKGSIADAEDQYRIITDHFAVTPEGKQAFITLAKLLTERKLYTEAIKLYRRAAVLHDDDDSLHTQCMFMTGFIYDEYLKNPAMAEVNYKWVLANAPGSVYSYEAEFMMLHLGEPVVSAEELQAQTIRQGRETESSDSVSGSNTVESVPLDDTE